jgi:hypothetical protein
MPEIVESVISREEDEDYSPNRRQFQASVSEARGPIPMIIQEIGSAHILESSEAEPESTVIKQGTLELIQ